MGSDTVDCTVFEGGEGSTLDKDPFVSPGASDRFGAVKVTGTGCFETRVRPNLQAEGFAPHLDGRDE